MGCGSSSADVASAIDNEFPDHIKKHLHALNHKFGLSDEFMDKFYDAFCEIDKTNKGKITSTQFLQHFSVRESKFAHRAFNNMDKGREGPQSQCAR